MTTRGPSAVAHGRCDRRRARIAPVADPRGGLTPRRTEPQRPSASFTAVANALSVKGFGRNENCSPSGRFLAKASSA